MRCITKRSKSIIYNPQTYAILYLPYKRGGSSDNEENCFAVACFVGCYHLGCSDHR